MSNTLIQNGSLESIFEDYAFNKMNGNGFLPFPFKYLREYIDIHKNW